MSAPEPPSDAGGESGGHDGTDVVAGSEADGGGGSATDATPGSGGDDPAADRTYEVELVRRDGPTARLRVGGDETVIEAAEAANVGLPYGCLHGACATCTAELLAGEVDHRRPTRGLEDRAVAEGYVLPCIAVPRSDCRLRVGHEVQAEVIGVPWR